MDKEILYTERQRFKQWWLWLILLGVNGLFLFGVFKQVIGGQQFGDKPMSNTGLLVATGLTFALSPVFIYNVILRISLFFLFHFSGGVNHKKTFSFTFY